MYEIFFVNFWVIILCTKRFFKLVFTVLPQIGRKLIEAHR